jgi:bisphosphoglycerate-dependent phosphoglycerate mutase
MTTRLYLVRHGATPLTAEDRFSGAANIHLSDEGQDQVKHLAQRLADNHISAVYCSPLDRTMETATILSKPHQLSPISIDGLREISHGHWEGLSRKEVEEQFPDEYTAWEADPFTFAPEGGESGISVLARAAAEEYLKEMYLYRTILQKNKSRRSYLEKRINEIQRQLFRGLGGELAFKSYKGPIPPHYNPDYR